MLLYDLGISNFNDAQLLFFLSINFLDAKIMYGSFIQQIIDFLIVAFCIFIFVKAITRFTRKEKEKEEKVEEVKKSEEILLLEEIRDLLKERK